MSGSVIGRLLALAAVLLLPASAVADQVYRVRMHTTAWRDKQGYVIIAMTSGLKGTNGSNQYVCIKDFMGNGRRGYALTSGGGGGGDLVYFTGTTTAPCTGLAPSQVITFYGAQNRFFYSHVAVNFAFRATTSISIPVFKDSIRFDLELPSPSATRLSFRDHVAIHVLSDQSQPAFDTADVLGADAICAFTAPTTSNGNWELEYFSPATYTPPGGSAPGTITVTFPAPPGGGGGPEPPEPPIVMPGVAIRPQPQTPFRDRVELEYLLDSPAPYAKLAVYDVRGRLVKLLHEGPCEAGTFVRVWDGRNEGGQRAGAGVYFARFTVGSRSDLNKLVLLP